MDKIVETKYGKVEGFEDGTNGHMCQDTENIQ